MKKKILATLAILPAMALAACGAAGTSAAHQPVPRTTATLDGVFTGPSVPVGWHSTYAHNFVTQGLGDWAPFHAPDNNAQVFDSTKPHAEFGLGIKVTATGQYARMDDFKATVGPSSFIQELVYVPPVPGTHEAANWPAWWTAGAHWPQDGEIDMLEGIAGNSGFHTFYGPSVAGKIGSPNRSAPGNVPGTGWLTISVLRQNGVAKAWYDNTFLGQVPLPTNGTEHLIFQNQSFSTTVCPQCFGPFTPATAYLSRVTVSAPLVTPPPTPTPTPTPTTPTPTPTGATFSESCPAKTSTSAAGCGGIDLGPTSGQAPGFLPGTNSQANFIDVQPDGWSGSQGPASVSGTSYKNWTATETDTPAQANSAQILTYPSTTFNYYQLGSPEPSGYDLNNITSMTSDYSETMPPVADKYTAENAYDIWLNNWATEVMIWTDVHYQGVDCGGPSWTPECSGSKLLGSFTYNGEKWSLYDNGGGINGFYMWIPDNGQALDAVSQSGGTGTVDLKAMLAQTAVSGGFTPASPLTQIGYGWEVADTGGQPLPFQMHNIDVNIAG